ncbi:hypothetical protein BKA58DRAFT_98503 [Alternaria rosae]|uniref:uncharacterized protein n=1 Tax=Alternaria rosae TaxID=1187941 RepID=UPI001E8E882F|nr:uncharacterized protein BKA58DRAFT_98503 [Alternaria rosae]KAH6878601.1 hypothetical protein BKA58DRAFT_98503 [Alternaria rosae]
MNSRSRIRKQLISKNHGFLTGFPSELRNQIYEYVFEDFNHAILVTHTAASTGDGRPMNASPRMGTNDSILFCNIPSVQLLRCCQQIYREGMDVILNGTTVMFKNRRDCFLFRDRDHLPFTHHHHNDDYKRIDLLPLLSIMVGLSPPVLDVEFTSSPPSPSIPSLPGYMNDRLRLGHLN